MTDEQYQARSDVQAAVSINNLFAEISQLTKLPIDVIAQDRNDLTLAHAELGRLIERVAK